ncbi:MAG: aldo/keto reductase [Elusimicrobia bacterium]|nr:aldo/keto reductase [Elusimicrobiota bacterium]
MKRRDFIVKSLLAAAGTAVLGGCAPGGRRTELGATGTGIDTRRFQHLDIPALGLGVMRLQLVPNAANNTQIDMHNFEQMVDYGMRHGMNFFDTAWHYHGGESEGALGRVLEHYKRDSVIISTKSPTRTLTSRDDVRRVFDEQLRRLRVDYIDFYLAHFLSHLTEDTFRNFRVYDELLKIKEEGLIKHLGFSYHGEHTLLQRFVDDFEWEFTLIQMNYLDWRTENEPRIGDVGAGVRNAYRNYEVLERAGLPIMVMTPLRGGALTRLTGSAAALLREEAPHDTQASFGLRWAASKPMVFNVLSGMANVQQMQENVATFTNMRPFTERYNYVAQRVAFMLQRHGEINCTTCNYCVGCPRRIPIAEIFDAYNEYRASGNGAAFLARYDAIAPQFRADRCIRCNYCNEQCPQALDIPPLLDEVIAAVNRLRAG